MALADFAGGLQDVLAQIVKDRLLKQQQDFENERALNAETLRRDQFGEGKRQFDAGLALDTDRLGLQRDQFGLDTRIYNEGAPQRAANLDQTVAETGEIRRRPHMEADARAHDIGMEDLRGKWGLRTIGAQGAQQRMTQAAAAGFREAAGSNASDKATAAQRAAEVRSLATELLNDPSLDNIFGPIDGRTPIVREGSANAEAKVKRLEGLLTLDNLGLMKGVLSDTDIKILQQAATVLANRTIGGQAARDELRRIAGDQAAAPGGRASGPGPGPSPARPTAADYIKKYGG